MKLEYHYSVFSSALLIILGGLFLYVGIDFVFLHQVTESFDAPKFVKGAVLLLGILTFSGGLKNIMSGRRVVVRADKDGVSLYVGALGNASDWILVPWNNLQNVEVVKMRPTFNKNHAGHLTKVLVFSFNKGAVEWPKVMLTRTRVHFLEKEDHDEIVLDAWLNSKKEIVAREILNFKK